MIVLSTAPTPPASARQTRPSRQAAATAADLFVEKTDALDWGGGNA